jgi:hypothetical protein
VRLLEKNMPLKTCPAARISGASPAPVRRGVIKLTTATLTLRDHIRAIGKLVNVLEELEGINPDVLLHHKKKFNHITTDLPTLVNDLEENIPAAAAAFASVEA